MKSKNKLIAVICAVVLIITSASVVLSSSILAVPDPADEANLLLEGGFDNGIVAPWNKLGASDATATADFAGGKPVGDKCVKINRQQKGISQEVTLQAGTSYELSFLFAPCVSGSTPNTVNVSVTGMTSGEVYYDEKISSSGTVYEDVTVKFLCLSNEKATVKFDRVGLGGSSIYIDDVSLIIQPITAEILKDGDFESAQFVTDSSAGWSKSGTNVTYTPDAFGGNTALLLNPGTGYVCQSGFYLFAGATYRLRFYHKGCSVGSGVYIADESDAQITYAPAGDDDEWNQYFYDFTVTETKSAKIIIKNLTEMEGAEENYSGGEDAYFDGISLHRITSSEADSGKWSGNYDITAEITPDTSECIKDGSFESKRFVEDPKTGWAMYTSSHKDKMIFTSAAYAISDGKCSICVPKSLNEAFYQVVTLKENTDYKISFDTLADNAGCSILLGESLENNNSIAKYTRIDKSDKMVSHAFIFNTGVTGEVYIVISNRSGYSAWFDNFSLKEIDTRVKGDLCFRESAQFSVKDITRTGFSVSWPSAKSKLYESSMLTCDLYISKQPINASNYTKLSSAYNYKGNELRRKTFTGLEEGTDYYLAVVAIDPAGNKAYFFSDYISTLKGIGKELINPSFETGDDTGWTVTEVESIFFTSTPSEGQYGCRMNGWYTRLSQQVKVEPNQKYVLAFDALDNSDFPFTYWIGSDGDDMLIGRVEANAVYTRKVAYYTASPTADQITISFSNNEDYNNKIVDNIYFKKIENDSIFFTSKPTLCISGNNFVIAEWQPVVSTDDSENVTYEIFVKDSEFNAGDLLTMTPIKVVKGTASLNAVVSGLTIDDYCWFAVRATDSYGHQAVEYSPAGYAPRSSTITKEEQKQSEGGDEEGAESFDADFDNSDDSDDSDDFGDDSLEFDDLDIDGDTDYENAVKIASRTVKKRIEETSKVKVVLGIVLIGLGALLILAGAALFIILMKKQGRKKVTVIAIIAAALAAILIAAGVFLLFNSTDYSFKKMVETKEIPIDMQVDDGEDIDLDETDESGPSPIINTNTNNKSDESSNNQDKKNTDKTPASNNNSQTTKQDEDAIDIVPNNVYNGKTYYVSMSAGNDSNDGLSSAKAFKTIDKVNSLSLASGDNVFFKCGDIWRGTELTCKTGVRYSSYGEGEKPAFYGSKMNYADTSKWTETSYPNVYAATDGLGSIGGLVFNNDESTSYFVNSTSAASLAKNGQICLDSTLGKICLYSDKGNPGAVYKSIEVITSNRMIYAVSGVTVENIKIKYAAYGVQCWGGADGNNIVVRNMDISYIGGRAASDGIRAGNAIEFWGNLDTVLIENNKITQCYDTGITTQFAGDSSEDIVMKNITVRHNDVSYCHWSTEFWIKIDDTNIGSGVFEKLRIHDNYFSHAGEEWSAVWRAAGTGVHSPWHIHMMTFTNYSSLDISIKNNTFDMSTGGIYHFGPPDYLPELAGNHYIQTKFGLFGRVYSKTFSFGNDIEQLVNAIEANPKCEFAN